MQSTDSKHCYQNTNGILIITRLNNSKIYMEPHKTSSIQSKLDKEQKWDITLLDFKLHLKTVVIKTICISIKADTQINKT